MPEQNIRLDIQYNGFAYSGWQRQPNADTVQERIERAIYKATETDVNLKAAGRTDAGVHAMGQVANFNINHTIPPDKYKEAISKYLPKDILIADSREVTDDFNARRSARWRKYRYIISLVKSAHYYNLRWEYKYPLNLDRMNELAKNILGKHDFSAFCVVSSLKDNNDCEILESEWRESSSNGLEYIYEIKGNRFLHSMVRSLIGCMVDCGRKNDYLTLKDFGDILNSRDHTRLTNVAPACGLYLEEVGY